VFRHFTILVGFASISESGVDQTRIAGRSELYCRTVGKFCPEVHDGPAGMLAIDAAFSPAFFKVQ